MIIIMIMSMIIVIINILGYGYSSLANVLVCMCAAAGALLYPCFQSYHASFDIFMATFLGLAVGTLSSDALLHLLPQVSYRVLYYVCVRACVCVCACFQSYHASFDIFMATFLGLAVGTLSSDALLHLLPQVSYRVLYYVCARARVFSRTTPRSTSSWPPSSDWP